MIAQTTIDQVNELSIVDVALKYLPDLKKNGANYSCVSPFNLNEKTPSFVVSPSKEMAKCFSTGKGFRHATKFVMELKQMDWIDVIQLLAKDFNIPVVYDESHNSEEAKAKRDKREVLLELNEWALKFWQKQPEVIHRTINWRCDSDVMETFELGFAPKGNLLYKLACQEEKPIHYLMELGLIAQGKNGYYDCYRERIMFPIRNTKGQLLGFSGRTILEDGKPKYYNSPESELYNKSSVLLNERLAREPIKSKRLAYVVEGNFDVTTCFDKAFKNVVAPCGTALTEEHIKKLSQWAKVLVFFYDGDKAGRNATDKGIALCLQHRVQPMVVECAEGLDPDEYVQSLYNNAMLDDTNKTPDELMAIVAEQIEKQTKDGILWKVEAICSELKAESQRVLQQQTVEQFIADIRDEDLRQKYTTIVCRVHKFPKADFKKAVQDHVKDRKEAEAEAGKSELPNLVNLQMLYF